MSSRHCLPLLFGLAAILLFVPPPGAQEEPEPPPLDSEIQERVRVSLVQVDFLVLDKKGRPITDLRKDEVRLWDAGEEQELLDLLPVYERKDGRRFLEDQPVAAEEEDRPEAAATPADPAPPAAPDPAPPPPPEPAPRWVVLLFDANNLSYQGRVRAGRALKDLVERELRPTDRVALMLDEDELSIRVPFTTDRTLLLDYLERPDGMTARARDLERRLKEMRDDVESCRESDSQHRRIECAKVAVGSFLMQTSEETQRSLDHLEALLRSLAAIPDRKILFYVSEGIVLDPGDVAAGAVEHAVGQLGYSISEMQTFVSRDYTRRLDRIFQLATDSRTGIYPVNTVRRMTDELFSAERRTDFGPENPAQVRTDSFEATWRQVTGTHRKLARATGGVALFKQDPMGLMDQQLQSADGVYNASYYPSMPHWERRKLKIQVERKGAKVFHLDRFRPLPQEGRRLDGELLIDTESKEMRKGYLRARLEVAGGTFAVAPESNPPASVASLFFELSDSGNRQVHSLYEVIAFPRGEKNNLVTGELKRPFALKVPPGDYTLRVEVRDVFGPGWGSFVRSFSVEGER